MLPTIASVSVFASETSESLSPFHNVPKTKNAALLAQPKIITKAQLEYIANNPAFQPSKQYTEMASFVLIPGKRIKTKFLENELHLLYSTIRDKMAIIDDSICFVENDIRCYSGISVFYQGEKICSIKFYKTVSVDGEYVLCVEFDDLCLTYQECKLYKQGLSNLKNRLTPFIIDPKSNILAFPSDKSFDDYLDESPERLFDYTVRLPSIAGVNYLTSEELAQIRDYESPSANHVLDEVKIIPEMTELFSKR